MPPYAQPQPERLAPQAPMKVERHSPSPPEIQEPPRPQTEALQPQPIRSIASKAKSIFTPIDGPNSLSSWGFSGNRDEPRSSQETTPNKTTSPESTSKPLPTSAPKPPQFAAPGRTDSMTSAGGSSKRPRLNLQIPNEPSDDESGPTAGASPQPSSDTATAAAQSKTSEQPNTSHTGVVLPPPSPSASALLSAGASGPGNPFARPLPPGAASNTSGAYATNNNIETPISALPSRFLNEGMLPSPSSFYPEWGFSRSGGGDGNMLPSPLTFPTPVQGTGSGFSAVTRDQAEDSFDRKRKTPDPDATPVESGREKKLKAGS